MYLCVSCYRLGVEAPYVIHEKYVKIINISLLSVPKVIDTTDERTMENGKSNQNLSMQVWNMND